MQIVSQLGIAIVTIFTAYAVIVGEGITVGNFTTLISSMTSILTLSSTVGSFITGLYDNHMMLKQISCIVMNDADITISSSAFRVPRLCSRIQGSTAVVTTMIKKHRGNIKDNSGELEYRECIHDFRDSVGDHVGCSTDPTRKESFQMSNVNLRRRCFLRSLELRVLCRDVAFLCCFGAHGCLLY